MYIDVDLTLVGDDLRLYPGVKDKLEQWKQKYTLICWSHGGYEYAKRVLEKHDLIEYFMMDSSVYLPKEKKWVKAQILMIFDKPDILVDDNPELLLSMPARIVIRSSEDWEKPDAELFKESREHAKRG